MRISCPFTCDVRSLAAFRISLALVLLVVGFTDVPAWLAWLAVSSVAFSSHTQDIVCRASEAGVWYADDGVLRRQEVSDYLGNTCYWSVNMANGSHAFQLLLAAAALVAASCMLVGYQTRRAVSVSWVLLLSLHTRNPLNLHGGDLLLRLLLFWAIPLPLSRCFSVDQLLSEYSPQSAYKAGHLYRHRALPLCSDGKGCSLQPAQHSGLQPDSIHTDSNAVANDASETSLSTAALLIQVWP